MNIELLDTNLWWGSWPFGLGHGEVTPASLAARLRRSGVTGGWVSPFGAVWADDPMPANRALLAACGARGKLRPLPVLNPAIPGWCEDLAELAASAGVTAVRLMPAYHGYRLTPARVRELAPAIAEAGVATVITVRLVDERHEHHAVRIKPVPLRELERWLDAAPTEPLLHGLTRHEVDRLVQGGRTSFFADLSFVEWEETLAVVERSLPLSKVMLGTLTPLHVTAAQVAKVTGSTVTPAKRRAVGVGNARRFFRA